MLGLHCDNGAACAASFWVFVPPDYTSLQSGKMFREANCYQPDLVTGFEPKLAQKTEPLIYDKLVLVKLVDGLLTRSLPLVGFEFLGCDW